MQNMFICNKIKITLYVDGICYNPYISILKKQLALRKIQFGTNNFRQNKSDPHDGLV